MLSCLSIGRTMLQNTKSRPVKHFRSTVHSAHKVTVTVRACFMYSGQQQSQWHVLALAEYQN